MRELSSRGNRIQVSRGLAIPRGNEQLRGGGEHKTKILRELGRDPLRSMVRNKERGTRQKPKEESLHPKSRHEIPLLKTIKEGRELERTPPPGGSKKHVRRIKKQWNGRRAKGPQRDFHAKRKREIF